jgi:hypothetical protein
VLDAPFLVVLVLFLHLGTHHDCLGVCANFNKVINKIDEGILVIDVLSKRLETSLFLEFLFFGLCFGVFKLVKMVSKGSTELGESILNKPFDQIDQKAEPIPVPDFDFFFDIDLFRIT